MTRRLDPLPPERMSPQQREFAERFTSGPRAAPDAAFRLVDEDGALTGPPAVWVLRPSLGMALQHLGGEIRFGLSLSDRACEAAILTVAEHEASEFELYAHVRAAERAGWTREEIATLRAGRDPEGADDTERVVLAVTRAVLSSPRLDDATFARASGALGREGLFELVTLIGYYRLAALQLNVFEVLPPAE